MIQPVMENSLEKEAQRFKVNFSGILGLLSKHLYTSTDVFIRELLQNAHDAIQFRKINDPNFSENGKIEFEYIDHATDPILIVSDNGCGMDMEQVEEFLSQIGSSSKRDLDQANDQGLIGQFGIGLLSCFMVGDEITLITRSFQDSPAVKWKAVIEGIYHSSPSDSEKEIGTTLFLPIRKELKSTYKPDKIRSLLQHYGTFLKIPIHFKIGDKTHDIGEQAFPWELEPYETLSFGRQHFSERFKHFIPLNSKSGLTKGIAYLFPYKVPFGSSVDHQVYIKNMLISNKAKEILPTWFFFARAIINSEELVPTASREDIHQNEILRQVKQDFESAIADYFRKMLKADPDLAKEIINTHLLAFKAFAADNDDFYRLIIPYLEMPTSKGYITIGQILKSGNKILFVDDDDKFKQLEPMLTANGQLVVNTGYVYDTELLRKLPDLHPHIRLERLDNLSFSDVFLPLDWSLEEEYKTFIEKLQDRLKDFQCEVILKEFAPASIPGIYHLTSNQKKIRDLERSKKIQKSKVWGQVLDLLIDNAQQHYRSQLYINVKNPLIQKLAKHLDHPHFIQFTELIYINALLIGRYVPNEAERDLLNNNLIHLLETKFN